MALDAQVKGPESSAFENQTSTPMETTSRRAPREPGFLVSALPSRARNSLGAYKEPIKFFFLPGTK